MKLYDLPLKARLRRAELKRQRYHADPEQRLKAINRTRQRNGREPYRSLEEAFEAWAKPAGNRRNGMGRFI